jgi:hypothetical protein
LKIPSSGGFVEGFAGVHFSRWYHDARTELDRTFCIDNEWNTPLYRARTQGMAHVSHGFQQRPLEQYLARDIGLKSEAKELSDAMHG